MITRDEAKQIRDYLRHGGVVYPGICRRGSYVMTRLRLDQYFTLPYKELPRG